MFERDEDQKITLEAQGGDLRAQEAFVQIVSATGEILVRRCWRIDDDPEVSYCPDRRGCVRLCREEKNPISKSLRKVTNRIARARRADWFREKKGERETGQRVQIQDAASGEENLQLQVEEASSTRVAEAELSTILLKELEGLSEKHRSVVRLHDLQGLTFWEIANTWDVTVAKVKGRYYYALKVLGQSTRLQRVAEEFFPGSVLVPGEGKEAGIESG